VEVRARSGISSPGVETGVFPTSESARVGALNMCSAVARAAMINHATDVRLKKMMSRVVRVSLHDAYWPALYMWANHVALFRLRPIGFRVCGSTLMMGEPCAIGVDAGGFDDVEFDHWMRWGLYKSN
jgi:hypothetical protein